MNIIGSTGRFFRLDKGNPRSIRTKANIYVLLALKSVSALTNFMMVPLTMNYLNPTNYGIWLTLSSVVSWMIFFDIGLGNGLRNKFAIALAKNEKQLAKMYVSTAYAFISLAMVAVLLIFLLSNQFVSWSSILNALPEMETELGFLAIIAISMFLLKMVLGLIGVMLLADQSPGLNGLIDVLSSIFSLIAVYILTKTTQSSLLALGIAISAISVVVPLAFSIWLFRTRFKEFAPSVHHVDKTCGKELVFTGFQFFLLQASGVIIFSTSNIIITQLFDPTEVTKYNIAFRYFAIATMAFNIVLTPMWSAFTEAFHRGELQWIKNAIKRLMQSWGVLCAGIAVLLLISGPAYEIWVGTQVTIPITLSFSVAVYTILFNWNSIYASFINGVGRIRLQLYTGVFIGIVNIPLAIYLGKALGLGSTGVVIAGCLCLLVGSVWAPVQTFLIVQGKAVGIWGK